jgi:serine/threonine protein kinase
MNVNVNVNVDVNVNVNVNDNVNDNECVFVEFIILNIILIIICFMYIYLFHFQKFTRSVYSLMCSHMLMKVCIGLLFESSGTYMHTYIHTHIHTHIHIHIHRYIHRYITYIDTLHTLHTLHTLYTYIHTCTGNQYKPSKSVKDFIAKLLVRDPVERLTAKEALEHPWLTDDNAVSHLPITNVITKLSGG